MRSSGMSLFHNDFAMLHDTSNDLYAAVSTSPYSPAHINMSDCLNTASATSNLTLSIRHCSHATSFWYVTQWSLAEGCRHL